MSRDLSLRLDLLDRQIVDADGIPIGRVDDLRLTAGAPKRAPDIEALLTGAQALGERVGGVTGGVMARIAARLRAPEQPPGPGSVDARAVAEIGDEIRLRVRLEELSEIAGLEHWLADRVIGPIPGSGDARE